ncbi:MAG TPA: tetratricopeptide repeat protein, partial [Bacteroidales bacterium]|nr:tetratricopeptide repeat protein [Bacteroidales bacterium]
MHHPQAEMAQARELYRTGKFSAARELFTELSINANLPLIMQEEAKFYAAASAAELMHRDTERKLLDFLVKYPANTYTNLAWFKLGTFRFTDKDYRNALQSFQNVNTLALTDEQLAEYYYKSGFCYMHQENFRKAQQYFSQITNANTPYTPAANYYAGYIAYIENRNSEALNYFNRVKDDAEFREQVLFHIIHINHRIGNYAEVVASAPQHLTRDRNKQNLEMARMIGDAHFRLANYSEAQRLLEHFHANSRRQPTRQESYQLGYIYFLTERWNDAIRHFQAVTTENDTLAQNAFYHLAASYLNTNQKQFASNAFLSAHRLPFNPQIREDALLNYAQLAVELGMNPYNEAIRAINQFLADFPNAQRRQEALAYLVHLYMTTNNYREALKSIEVIPNRNRPLNEAYQIITYFRGVELFNDREYAEAIAMFDKTRTQPFDQKIHTQSLFWTAESYYRLQQLENASQYYNLFLNSPGSRGHILQFVTHYNLGYIHFANEEYSRAIESFNRFLANERRESARMVMDAYIRSGDALFISKRYAEAIQVYDKAIQRIPAEGDYPTLQKARALGALGRNQEKLSTLQTFMRNFRTSGYAPEALFEAGNTALILNNSVDAARYFNQ